MPIKKSQLYSSLCPTAEIWKDNTLSSPHFKETTGGLKRHDYVVAKPPALRVVMTENGKLIMTSTNKSENYPLPTVNYQLSKITQ